MKKFVKYILLTAISLVFWGCEKEPFTLSGMIEDHFFLKSGNQHMPITVAGNVDSKKFIFIIHGGPGGNGLDYRDAQIKDLVEKEFVVVYWDQRFAGNTQGNGGNVDITEFRKDIKNLLLILKNKYGPDIEIYMLGHSWGGFLAPYFLVDGDNQKMVNGWIQVGGAHNYNLNDSLTREMLISYGEAELATGNNAKDWNEIVDWCKENGFQGAENSSKLNQFARGAEELFEDITVPESSPDLKKILADARLSKWSNGITSGNKKIDGPTFQNPNSDQLFKVKLPTLLLWGKYDFVCPPELAKDIEKNIGSSDVKKIIYSTSGHSPMVNEPEKFWTDLVEWVRIH